MTPAAQAIGRPLVAQNVFGQPLTIFGLPVDRENYLQESQGVVQSRRRETSTQTNCQNDVR